MKQPTILAAGHIRSMAYQRRKFQERKALLEKVHSMLLAAREEPEHGVDEVMALIEQHFKKENA